MLKSDKSLKLVKTTVIFGPALFNQFMICYLKPISLNRILALRYNLVAQSSESLLVLICLGLRNFATILLFVLITRFFNLFSSFQSANMSLFLQLFVLFQIYLFVIFDGPRHRRWLSHSSDKLFV